MSQCTYAVADVYGGTIGGFRFLRRRPFGSRATVRIVRLPRDQVRLVAQRRQIVRSEHQFGGGRRPTARHAQHRSRQRHELHRECPAVRVHRGVGRLARHGQSDELRHRSAQRVVQGEHVLLAVFGHLALADVGQAARVQRCRGLLPAGKPSGIKYGTHTVYRYCVVLISLPCTQQL